MREEIRLHLGLPVLGCDRRSFRLQLRAQPLHELTVLLHLLTLHHGDDVVLDRELLAEFEEDFVIFLLATHQ